MVSRKCAEQRMGFDSLVSVFGHPHAGQVRPKVLWTLHFLPVQRARYSVLQFEVYNASPCLKDILPL
jgi:hypothetical protein